jgi:hypothetical protein
MSIRALTRFRSGAHRNDHSLARSVVVAAKETIALVLDEESAVPEDDQDVNLLVLRLRGHLMQLGPAADASLSCASLADALDTARLLAAQEEPDNFMKSRVHLRQLAIAVQSVLTEMSKVGLACMHQPECPPADATDCQAAQALTHCPELGYSLLCNGVLTFEDTGCLMPNGRVVSPRRPLPPVAVGHGEVDS